MDATRFDNLARAFATSRRGALALAVKGAGAIAAGLFQNDRQKPFQRAGKRCDHGQRCGALAPCTNGVCTPTACLIAGQIVDAAATNADNPCQSCSPSVATWQDWTTAIDGAACGNGLVCCGGSCCGDGECCDTDGACASCEPGCEIEGEHADPGAPNPNHECQFCAPERDPSHWSPVDDFTVCGATPGRVCCNGNCCSPTECCTGVGACEECGPHCRIDSVDRFPGDPNPDNPCEACDPARDPLDWSPGNDDAVCGGDLDSPLRCCAGHCCGPDQCCRDGACGACQCVIENHTYDAGDHESGNECHVCEPASSRDSWTAAAPDAPCGLTNDRHCCAGLCCPSGQCCNDIGECEQCGCVIDNDKIADGVANPNNTCQVCDAHQDRFAWTVLGDKSACGTDQDDRVCCGGNCCQQGDCCTGGACQPCGGCTINGKSIPTGTPNDANPCQVCDPSKSVTGWSPAAKGVACGANGETCCGGECCASNLCCLLDACGECLCAIEGTNHADGEPNAANPCEYCAARSDPFTWSQRDNGFACSAAGDQVCCAGSCCDPGFCCTSAGACDVCGCEVGETNYPDGTVNPDNSCQICHRALDPAGWSPVDDKTPCGDNGDRVCCLGLCCDPGQCCQSGICGPCGCQIDGASVADQTINPDNPCQICDIALDPVGWSPLSDQPCGADGALVCCDGICCDADECCGISGACEPCAGDCVIAGHHFLLGQANPNNACQVCNPDTSTTDWTNLPNDQPCPDDPNHVCCAGACCVDDGCCYPFEGGLCSIEFCDDQIDLCAGTDPCGCTINSVFYPIDTKNPDNPCEVCYPSGSIDSWWPGGEENACGPNGDRFCCQGVCCDLGACCDFSNGGVCKAAGSTLCVGCIIAGHFYRDETPNLDVPCQICDFALDPSGWTQQADNFSCGPGSPGVCCQGICCDPGMFCSSLTGQCAT